MRRLTYKELYVLKVLKQSIEKYGNDLSTNRDFLLKSIGKIKLLWGLYRDDETEITKEQIELMSNEELFKTLNEAISALERGDIR